MTEKMEEQEVQGINLVEQLKQMDLIQPVKGMIEAGSWKLTDDNKIQVKAFRQPDRCWRLFHPSDDRDCLRWNYIYCQLYRIVPRGCRHCWKVVHRIPNLAELFRLDAAAEGMGLHMKLGVDHREQFGGLDQCVAFWYTPLRGGLKAGRNLYKQVHDVLKAHYGHKDFHLILKRGCTEMEAMIPSDQWDEHAEAFDAMEAYLDDHYEVPRPPKHEIGLMKVRVHKDWIMRRARVGDPTAAYFGARVRETVTYHDSEHSELDFPGLGEAPLLKGVDDE